MRSECGKRLLQVLIGCGALLSAASKADPAFKTPSGFLVSRAAGPPAIEYPMFATLDDKGRLFVAESSGLDLYDELRKLTRRCRISVLQDTNRDGVYDKAHVFADELVFPMGLVWRYGKLYVADPPELVILEDTDRDGRADKRTVILSGFGHTDNGSLHGLTFGPDGWLYMTVGEPDGYRLKRRDGSILEGHSGALLRCKPDGSEVEVISRGFENLVEIVFLPTGEIIGSDNWFQQPKDGIRDGLVHLVEGGLYPYAPDKGTRQIMTGDPLPALALYPAVALSGLMRYEGTAFPAKMTGNLFSAQFNARKIVRHQLTREGSTFRSSDEDFLTTDDPDFHPSDVLEDKDGSLLVVDTGSWYVQHCPTGRIRKAPAQGGIYRVRFAGEKSPGEPLLTDSEIVAGTAREIGRRGDRGSEGKLIALLKRPEPYVRLAAAEALAHCGSAKACAAICDALAENPDRFLEHALTYALYRLAGEKELRAALEYLHPRPQQAGLILLEQTLKIDPDAVMKRLAADDYGLRRAAHWVLQRHPEWVKQALRTVRELAAQASPSGSEQETLTELLLAFRSNLDIQKFIGSMAESKNAPITLIALECMARSDIAGAASHWKSAIQTALMDPSAAIQEKAVRVVETLKVGGMEETLAGIVHDERRAKALRVHALRAKMRQYSALAQNDFELLLRLLGREQEPATRLAASEIVRIAKLDAAQFEAIINAVKSDTLISPTVMMSAAERIELTTTAGEALAEYVVTCSERGVEFPRNDLIWIRDHVSGQAKATIADLLTGLDRQRAQKLRELDYLQPLLQGGSAFAGRNLFFGKAGCSACHRVQKEGAVVGPDLTHIGGVRSGRDLLESVLLPSSTIAQGYENYQITTTDGEELTGVRVPEADDSFVLRDASGAEHRLLRQRIKAMERLNLSLMPEGLLSALSRDEIRDLFAYLQAQK